MHVLSPGRFTSGNDILLPRHFSVWTFCPLKVADSGKIERMGKTMNGKDVRQDGRQRRIDREDDVRGKTS